MPRLPHITAKELVKFLKRPGFAEDRQVGSHLTLWNERARVLVTVPVHPGDLGRGLVMRILKDAGFSTDDFVRLR